MWSKNLAGLSSENGNYLNSDLVILTIVLFLIAFIIPGLMFKKGYEVDRKRDTDPNTFKRNLFLFSILGIAYNFIVVLIYVFATSRGLVLFNDLFISTVVIIYTLLYRISAAGWVNEAARFFTKKYKLLSILAFIFPILIMLIIGIILNPNHHKTQYF